MVGSTGCGSRLETDAPGISLKGVTPKTLRLLDSGSWPCSWPGEHPPSSSRRQPVAPLSRCRSSPTTADASTKNGHHPRVRRKFLGPFIGAGLAAFLVVLAQATAGRRAWVGCPGDFDSPPCVRPAWWSWARVSAVEVVIGALIGAGLLCVVAALTAREHQRRRQWGEL